METAEVKNDLGTIRVADRVIALTAKEAALRVPGIAGMGETFLHSISSVISDGNTDGVHVGFKEGVVTLDLYVCVRHGERIPAIALQLQEMVKEEVSDALGVRVAAVNVNVSDILFDKDKPE